MTFTFSPGDTHYLPVILAIIAVAAVALLLSVRRLLLGISSKNWKPVRATVISVSIDHSTDTDNDTWYRPRMQYSFIAGSGQRFRSSRLSYRSLETLNYGDVASSMTGVLPGKEIRVHYNPGNPKQSVYFKGVSLGNYLEIGVLVMLLLFAADGIRKHVAITDPETIDPVPVGNTGEVQ